MTVNAFSLKIRLSITALILNVCVLSTCLNTWRHLIFSLYHSRFLICQSELYSRWTIYGRFIAVCTQCMSSLTESTEEIVKHDTAKLWRLVREKISLFISRWTSPKARNHLDATRGQHRTNCPQLAPLHLN